MNWFTRESLANVSDKEKREIIKADGSCVHARRNIINAAFLRAENDSHGRVSTYVCCCDCDAKAQEERDNQLVTCGYCFKDVRSVDTAEYRWYGFSYREGDEAKIVCKNCKTSPTHQADLASDKRERQMDLDDLYDDLDD